jgi:hypothetical protein
MIDPTSKAWRRLGCAVLVQAWRDAHNTNGARAAAELGLPAGLTLAGDARAFLQSDGAAWLVLALDLDPAGLDQALGGLRPSKWGQLRIPGM